MGRAASVVCMVALWVAGGCATAPRAGAPAQAQWNRVCAQMHGRPSAPAESSATARPLSAAQVDDLQRRATAASGCVVHIETCLVSPARAPERPGLACTTGVPSGGTGVVIDGRGLILTNEHVVRNAIRVSVVLADGTRHVARAWVADEHLDLAVVQIDAGTLPALAVGGESAQPGAAIVVVGRATANAALAARTGVVATTAASLQAELDPTGVRLYSPLIETTAALDAGFSGSPLLDQRGRCIGLAVATRGTGETRRGYAIPFTARVRGVVARLQTQLDASAAVAPPSPISG